MDTQALQLIAENADVPVWKIVVGLIVGAPVVWWLRRNWVGWIRP